MTKSVSSALPQAQGGGELPVIRCIPKGSQKEARKEEEKRREKKGNLYVFVLITNFNA